MARIRFYPEDNNLHPSDHIVGTDEVSGDGATRVFTIDALTEYLRPIFVDGFVPPAVPPGFLPVSTAVEGSDQVIYEASPLQIKDVEGEDAPTVIFTSNTVNGTISIFQGSLGGPRMIISPLVDGGFSPEPSVLAGLDFSATFGGNTVSGNVGEFDRDFDDIPATGPGSIAGFVGGFSYKYNLDPSSLTFSGSISSLPLAADGAFTPTSITFSATDGGDITLRRALCINSDTVNLGDLDVMGVFRVGGVEIDLASIPGLIVDVGAAQGDISDLQTTKADVSDLHPAASVPDPTPAAAGVAATAITGIAIDPTTQEITVTRGTVPVIIGGDGDAGNFSVSGLVVSSLDFDNTGDVSFTPSFPTTDSASIIANVNPAFLSGVEGRLDVLENVSALTVDGNTDVSVINLDDATLSASPEGGGTVTLSATIPELIGLSDVNITESDLRDNDIIFWNNTDGEWQAEPATSILSDFGLDLEYLSGDDQRIVTNVTDRNTDGAPITTVDQFQLPIASTSTYGLVKVSGFVTDAFIECPLPVVDSVEAVRQYNISLESTALSFSGTEEFLSGGDIGTHTWQTSGSTQFTLNAEVLDADGNSLRTEFAYSDLSEAGAFLNVRSILQTDEIAGLYLGDLGGETLFEYTVDSGDPVDPNLILARPTGRVVDLLFTDAGIDYQFVEYEFVNADGTAVVLPASAELTTLRGTIDEVITEGDDSSEELEACIEVVPPVMINGLVTADGVINLGDGGGTLVTHFQFPTDPDVSNTIVPGNTVQRGNDLFTYIGDGPTELRSTTDLLDDNEFVDFEFQIDHGVNLPDSNLFNDRLFILEQVDGGRDPGLYRYNVDIVDADSSWVPVANVADATGIGFLPQDDTVSVFLGPGDITRQLFGGALFLNGTNDEIEIEAGDVGDIGIGYTFPGDLDAIGNDTNTTYTFNAPAVASTLPNQDVVFALGDADVSDVRNVTATIDFSGGVTAGSNIEFHPTEGYRVEALGVDTAEIANDAVTYEKIQNVVGSNVVLGSPTGGIVEEVQISNDYIVNDTIAEVKLDIFDDPAVGDILSFTSNGMEWIEADSGLIAGPGININDTTDVISVDVSNGIVQIGSDNDATIGLETLGAGFTAEGSGTQIPVITTDVFGRVTAITTETNFGEANQVITTQAPITGNNPGDAANFTIGFAGLTGDVTADTAGVTTVGVDVIDSDNIVNNAIGNEHLQNDAVDLLEINAASASAGRVLAIDSAGTGLEWSPAGTATASIFTDTFNTSNLGVISIDAATHGLLAATSDDRCYVVQVYRRQAGIPIITQVIPDSISISTGTGTVVITIESLPDTEFRVAITGLTV